MTTPHIINKVLPTAYVTVYPSAGVSLSTASCIAPSAAVVVRAPAQHPSVIAAVGIPVPAAIRDEGL